MVLYFLWTVFIFHFSMNLLNFKFSFFFFFSFIKFFYLYFFLFSKKTFFLIFFLTDLKFFQENAIRVCFPIFSLSFFLKEFFFLANNVYIVFFKSFNFFFDFIEEVNLLQVNFLWLQYEKTNISFFSFLSYLRFKLAVYEKMDLQSNFRNFISLLHKLRVCFLKVLHLKYDNRTSIF